MGADMYLALEQGKAAECCSSSTQHAGAESSTQQQQLRVTARGRAGVEGRRGQGEVLRLSWSEREGPAALDIQQLST